jgi:Tfp pilus assembly protein PilX
MKLLRNEKGIALVTSLLLTLIGLGIIMVLMYSVTANIKVSAASKRYKNVVEAAYGGVSLSVNEFIPSLNNAIFGNYSSGVSELLTKYADSNKISLDIPSLACLRDKLDNATANWNPSCSKTPDPKDKPDMTFVLKSTLSTFSRSQGFKVYTKIVGTPIKGNTDKADRPNLRKGENVIESAEVEGTGVTIPTTYRVEVMAEQETNPREKANISVLYAY